MPLCPLLALFLARVPIVGALPPMALPSSPSPRAMDRAEVDHVLVVSLAFLQMDSQPMVPLEQGALPLAARPALDTAMAVAEEPSGRCVPERSLLVVLDHRVPRLTQGLVEEAVAGACFETRWLLVAPVAPGALAKPSTPVTLGQSLDVVPYPLGSPALPSAPAPQSPETGGLAAVGQAPRLGEWGAPPTAAPVPLILGGLEAEDLTTAMAAQNEAISACAKGTPGQLVLTFNVDPDGHPVAVEVQSSTMQDPEIGACIAEVVGGLSLPPGQQTQVVLPVVLPAP